MLWKPTLDHLTKYYCEAAQPKYEKWLDKFQLFTQFLQLCPGLMITVCAFAPTITATFHLFPCAIKQERWIYHVHANINSAAISLSLSIDRSNLFFNVLLLCCYIFHVVLWTIFEYFILLLKMVISLYQFVSFLLFSLFYGFSLHSLQWSCVGRMFIDINSKEI